jgi:surface antigen
MKLLSLAMAGIVGLALTACDGTKETTGTVVGAAGGAAAGAALGGRSVAGRVIGAAIGAGLGAFVGREIGRSLDRADQAYMAQTQQRAMDSGPVGQPQTWQNPESGNSGRITPTSTAYQGPQGRPCRNFTETVMLKDGRSETVSGRRCQNPDGSWEFVG